ncbi:MAG: ornithine carbamoyltransferase [Acidobacteria bacterium]|nr:ornithine carbamoyltransferase [Acidobacteriota bacterium]
MGFNLKGRSLLTLKDVTAEEIRHLLEISHQVKRERRAGVVSQRFLGKTLALIFEKRSTRTRCAFETAFGEEGGYPVFLSIDDIQLGSKESVEDTARVLGRMFDAIQFRGFKQSTVEALATHSGVPVYNGLTDLYHPTQVLADLQTVEESFGRLKGIRMVYAGDGRNNMANTLMIGCAKMGLHYTIAAPQALWPEDALVAECNAIIREERTGGSVAVTDSMAEAVKGAHVLYTDVWASMGEESQKAQREAMLRAYQVNDAVMDATGNVDAIFMHCLPAVKGQEVTAELLDGPRSKAWDEAENRKHTIKALMLATI